MLTFYNATSTSVERLVHCPASHILPRAERSTDRSVRGNIIHQFCDLTVSEPLLRDKWLLEVPKPFRETCDRIKTEKAIFGMEKPITEMAYYLDLVTGKAGELGRNLNRKYNTKHGQIGMTMDVVSTSPFVIFVDWKSGANIGPPELSWQMMCMATTLGAYTGAKEVECRVAYIQDFGESPKLDIYIFTQRQMRSYFEAMRDGYALAQSYAESDEIPPISMGPWCEYCPSLIYCDGFKNLAANIMPELTSESYISGNLPVMSHDMVLRGWHKLKSARILLDRLEDVYKTYGKQNPIPLGGGLEYGPVKMSKDYFSSHDAISMLKKLGASVADIESLTKKTEYVQIRKRKIKNEQ